MRRLRFIVVAAVVAGACSEGIPATSPLTHMPNVTHDVVAPNATVSFLSNVAANRCMQTYAGRSRAGTRLVIDLCADVPSEHYTWTAANELRVFEAMCVTVDGHGYIGDPIDIESCRGRAAQQWHFTRDSQLQGLHGLCIATRNASVATDTRLILGTCQPIPSQQWGQQPYGTIAVAAANDAQECASPSPDWIWCDDFEQDRRSQYFEVDDANGSLARVATIGRGGSTALVAHFAQGQVNAGNLKLAFGRTPSTTFRPVDAGTANYRELYWRLWLKTGPGWTGGSGEKLSRAMILAGSNWSQAMVAHVWGGDPPNQNYLQLDPVSGTDAAGTVLTTKYNDLVHFRWLGRAVTQTALFDSAHVGNWYCIEAHVRLNDAGQSNGVFDLWVNGNLEARRTSLNWIGAYNSYGLNALFIENYWNTGAPVTEERYIDNLVVSTKPIACDGVTPAADSSAVPPPPAPVAGVSVTLGSSSIVVGGTTQATAVLRDSAGNVLTGRSVTWTSSAPSAASISASGAVSALAAGSAIITATSGGVSGSQSLTVTAPPPPPESSCTNEPAGLTPITDQPWNAAPPNLNAVDAYGWGVDRDPENLAIATDATAPRSPSNVIHGIIPAGWLGGTAPFRVERPFASQPRGTVFECLWFLHSPNFTDGGNFATKVSYYRGAGQNNWWGFESAGGPDQFYFTLEIQGGGGDRTIRTSIPQGPGTTIFQALPTGVWRKYEILTVSNTPGVANGILKVWANGVLIINLSDMAWWGAGQTPAWTGVAWEPVYGGGTHSPPVTMYQAIDHWYISGK